MSTQRSSIGPPPLAPSTWPSWFAAGLLCGLSYLPGALRRLLSRAFAALLVRRRGGSAAIARLNLEICFPELDATAREALYRRHLEHLVASVLLTPRLWFSSAAALQQRVDFEGLSHLDQARQDGKPVIFLISHTVALDFGMIALSPRYPMTGFYKPFKNPVVDWLVHRARSRFGGAPFARGEGFRAAIKRLKGGEGLCYLSDEDLGADGSVFAEFFGREKATLAMLPRIVRHTDAVVLPMNTFHDIERDRMRVQIEAPLQPYPGEGPVDSARIMNASIESMVRQHPAQYLWQLKYFRTDPGGGISRYRQIEAGTLPIDQL